MILVTGATGHLGSAVVRQLLKRVPADRIAAFVRDEGKAARLQEEGVDVRVGDFGDRASLDRAMTGVEQALLISGTDDANGLRQHFNVVDAAKAAGVRRIAYTSRSLKDRDRLANRLMDRHFQTEDYIKASGLDYVLFQNSLYMDTIPMFVGQEVFERGIQLPAGGGRVAFALRSEQGEAIANALVEGESRVYQLTGDAAWTFGDVAEALGVAYVPIEASEFEARLRARGLPEAAVARIVPFLKDIRDGQEDVVGPDLEPLLGRRSTGLEEGLKTVFDLSSKRTRSV